MAVSQDTDVSHDRDRNFGDIGFYGIKSIVWKDRSFGTGGSEVYFCISVNLCPDSFSFGTDHIGNDQFDAFIQTD